MLPLIVTIISIFTCALGSALVREYTFRKDLCKMNGQLKAERHRGHYWELRSVLMKGARDGEIDVHSATFKRLYQSFSIEIEMATQKIR